MSKLNLYSDEKKQENKLSHPNPFPFPEDDNDIYQNISSVLEGKAVGACGGWFGGKYQKWNRQKTEISGYW